MERPQRKGNNAAIAQKFFDFDLISPCLDGYLSKIGKNIFSNIRILNQSPKHNDDILIYNDNNI